MNIAKLTVYLSAFLYLWVFTDQQAALANPPKLNWRSPWVVGAGPDVVICLGDTTQLEATGANSYLWSPATGLSCTNCPKPFAFPSVTTTYTVTGDDGTTDEVVVKVLSPPIIQNINAIHPTDCNLNNGSIAITTVGNNTYEYSIDNGASWQNNGVFTALSAGNYPVKVRLPNGVCVVDGGNFVLTAPPSPTILNIIKSDPTFCDVANGSIVIAANGGISPLQYSIDNGLTWQVQNTFQLLGSGNYQIKVRNANGSCVVGGGTVSLTGSPDEAFIADIFAASPTNCNETNGLITVVVPNNGGQFEFSINGGIDYQSSNVFTGLDEGIYHVVVRRTDGSCINSGGYITLVSPNRPTIYGISAVNPQGCGGMSGNITILAFGPSTLQFSVDGGTTWFPSNIFPNLPASNYVIAVRNSDGSCTTLGQSVTLVEPGPPTINAVSANSPTACGLTNGSIAVTATGTGQLEYSVDGGSTWQLSSNFNNLNEGSYAIKVRYTGGGCPIDYASNPVVLDAPGAPPVIGSVNLTQPSDCGVLDGKIVVNASGSGPLTYSINGGTSFQTANTFNGLGAGDYEIVVAIAGGNCTASTTRELIYSNCADTLQIAIPANANINYCIDPVVFNNLGTITGSAFCNQGSALTVAATSLSQNCVELVPAPGFSGASPDLICVIHCFNNSATICDTTYLSVTVQAPAPCGPIFIADTVSLPFTGNPTNYCVPIPLTALAGFDLSLNGTPLNSPFSCDFEQVYAYSYTVLPGAGLGGPYQLDAWEVNGNVYSGFFNDANGLLVLMQAFDPAGNWQINSSAGLIFGGDPNSSYADLAVTHLPSGTPSVLNVNSTFLPTGFTIGLTSPGISTFIVANPVSGCADTLYLNAVLTPVTTDTVFLTTSVNLPTASTCLDPNELPGNTIVNVGYCDNPDNGVAPLTSTSCVYYFPNLNFAGQDAFCMIACDGGFPQVCDTTYFVVNVLPENDTVYLTIPSGETSIDTCLSSFVVELPGNVDASGFCNINNSEILGAASANCLSFDATGSFYGTTTVCALFCNNGFCEENTIIITIEPPVVCEDLFGQAQLTVVSPYPSNTYCLPVPTGEIVNYTVTVDGAAYNQSYIPCGFDELAVYNYVNLPSGPYTVNAWTANGNLFSGVVSNIDGLVAQMNAWDPNGDWAINPAAGTIQGGQGGNYSNMEITPSGSNTFTLAVNQVIFPLGSQIDIAGFGTHPIILTHLNGCADTLALTYVQHVVNSDTLVFNTNVNTAVSSLCGNTDELLGNLFSVSFCGLPSNGAIVPNSATCFTYTPNTDFVGTDTVCVVFCDDNPITVCDTFVFVVNVGDTTQPCPTLFSPSEVFTTVQNGDGEVCLPLNPLQILDYQVVLDGQAYGGGLTPCDIDQVYIYFYGQVFAQGNNGPYSVTWTLNGQNFSSVVQNMQALVSQMNVWDVSGNWNIEQPTFSIISTNDNGVYGTLIITHIATGILSTISPVLNGVPAGTAIQISGQGQHEVILQNQTDGCSDTLTINALESVNQLDIFTFENTPSDVECIDVSGLPGVFSQLTLCQQPANGVLFLNANCLNFIPTPGFTGSNSACVVACDNLGNCDTTLINITVDPLCSLFDFFPDSTVQVQVPDCADIAAYCTPIQLDSMASYGVLDNGFPYTGGFSVCNGQFAQIALDTGFHELVFVHLATGCQDTLRALISCTSNDGCGLIAISPLNIQIDDCDTETQFCVSVPIADLPNYVVSDNGNAFAGNIGLCDINAATVGLTLDTGLHVLILQDTVKGCADTFEVAVLCTIIEDVTVDTTLQQGESVVLCLEDYGYDAVDIDSVVAVCAIDSVISYTINPQTWCITIVGDTIGLDTACFEVFIGDTSAIFTVNVEVISPCPVLIPNGIWASSIDCALDTGLLCLPFNFQALQDKELVLDGQPFTGPFLGCGLTSIFALNYDALPSAGNLGPYIVVNWNINGTDFTGVFNTIQELADLMNQWDPTGNWQVVFDPFSNSNLIQGGNSANIYSGVAVEQSITGIQVTLGLSFLTVPTAIAIELEAGVTHQLTITDTVTLCSETALLQLVCLNSDVVNDTILLGTQDTFCLDLSELVGSPVSVTNLCAGSNGETVAFSFDGNCVIYQGNEPGFDTACVVVCDDAGICDTTYFNVWVDVLLDSLPIAVNDTFLSSQDDPYVAMVLVNDTVQFLLTVEVVTQPLHGSAQVFPNGTINYVPEPGYCDEDVPDSFTYAICNPVGCDTATVYITVLCKGLEIFDAFSPNDDGVNETFKINGLQDYPNHHLFIYNRWGVLVYESQNYLSDWGGTYKDKLLPDGTYFYVLDLGDGNGVEKGYVVILR